MPVQKIRRSFKYAPQKVEIIKRVVAKYGGVTPSDLLRYERSRRLVRPRQIAIFLTRELAGMSWPAIGAEFLRDHTTCVYAFAKIAKLMREDESFLDQVSHLSTEVERQWKAREAS